MIKSTLLALSVILISNTCFALLCPQSINYQQGTTPMVPEGMSFSPGTATIPTGTYVFYGAEWNPNFGLSCVYAFRPQKVGPGYYFDLNSNAYQPDPSAPNWKSHSGKCDISQICACGDQMHPMKVGLCPISPK